MLILRPTHGCNPAMQGSEKGLNPRDARPEPLKKDDHAVDALRYLLFSEAQIDGATPTSTTRGGDFSAKGVQLSLSGRSQPLLSENGDRITTGSDNPYVRRSRREFFGRRR